jgi:hypothetical protein
MLRTLLTLIEGMIAPRAQMLAAMPPSAVRQVLFSL